MLDEPQVKVWPQGQESEFPEGPPTAVITHRGCRLVLRFSEGDFKGEGDVQELQLQPGKTKLTAKALRQFAPDAEVYLAYARAAMRILGPEGTPEKRIDAFRDAGRALRAISGPGRGLSEEFYRTIGLQYEALVSGGERHPVKALAEKNHVTISAASRWVKGARERGYIKGGGRTR